MIKSIEILQKEITIETGKCFNLALSLDCGQAFRWKETENGIWHGVVQGRVFNLYQKDENLVLKNATEDDAEIMFDYFDLSRDYDALCSRFSEDKYLKQAVSQYYGIRILHQDPWEALCSFIISQNNNIPRIKGIIERLCEAFGEEIGNGDYSFPLPQKLAGLKVEDLSYLRSGFRAKYIIDAAQKIAGGEVDLSVMSSIDIEEAREQLMRIKGVGPKVAECTLLYGCKRAEALPKDVWVKRILNEYENEKRVPAAELEDL